ncbi:MAG: hypothetical protein JNN27_14670 [Planctomycetes bacterium]|nr:hypothetical protein [Planctomycetota bacterium]
MPNAVEPDTVSGATTEFTMSRLLSSGALVALLSASALPTYATAAQSLPTAPGNNGFYVFVERLAAGPDQLIVHNPDPGFFAPPATATNVVTLTGQISNQHNRRALQSRFEVAPTLAYDGVTPVPHILVPTVFSVGGVNTLSVESAHFVPGSCSSAGVSCVLTMFSAQGARFDYDMISVGATGTVFVEFSNGLGGAAARTVVEQLQLTPGAPATLVNRFSFNQAPTPFATRMTFDAATNRLIVPLLNAIGNINVTAGTSTTSALTPFVPGTGVRYQVGSNIALGFNAIGGQNTVFGLARPGPISGHGWGAFNSTTGVAAYTGGDPFGVGRALSPGFSEPAVSLTGGFAVAVIPVSTPSAPGGGIPTAGALGLLRGSPAAATLPTTVALNAGPALIGAFGNPELARPAGGSVVTAFAADSSTGRQFVVAVGLGGATPLGSLTTSAPLAGGVDLLATDRPWNLPGGANYVVADSGAGNLLTYTIAAGAAAPTLTLNVASPIGGNVSTALNIFSGASALFGLPSVPAALVGYANPVPGLGTHVAAIGLPLAAAGTQLTFADPINSPGLGGVGAYVWTPPPPVTVGILGARTPVFNASTALGVLPAAPVFAYPGVVPATTIGAITFQGGYYGATPAFYVSGPPIVSELVAF